MRLVNAGRSAAQAARLRLCRMGARQQSQQDPAPTIVPRPTRQAARCLPPIPTASISAIASPSWRASERRSRSRPTAASSSATARSSARAPSSTVQPLSGIVEADGDPCAALARDVEVPAGGELSTDLAARRCRLLARRPRELIERRNAQDFDSAPGGERERLARFHRHSPGRHARQSRSMRWSIPGCPIRACVPHPGALGLLSGQRRLRLPRPVAGYAGASPARPVARAGDRSSTPHGGSSRKATCSIGGCRAPARASAP